MAPGTSRPICRIAASEATIFGGVRRFAGEVRMHGVLDVVVFAHSANGFLKTAAALRVSRG